MGSDGYDGIVGKRRTRKETAPRRYKDKYPHGRAKGFTNYKPRKHKLLVSQILEVRDRYEKWTLHPRGYFYRLLEEYGYKKTDSLWTTVKDALTSMRRGRLLPFEDVGDNRTQVFSPPISYSGPADYWRVVRSLGDNYRRHRGEGQPSVIELWVESSGTVDLVKPVADRYGVGVYTGKGFSGVNMMHAAAKRAVERDLPTVILHLGDLDSSGENIFDAVAEDVRLFVEGLDGFAPEVTFVRVAITREQVRRLKLPTKPGKSTDKRGDFEGGTVQLEALKPPELAQMVEDAILAHYDRETWESVLALEESEWDELHEQIGRYLPDDEE
jgi:hypothetical protein